MTEAVVVLDLDDTLYLERDYVRSGFAAVARTVEVQYGATGFFEIAWALFEDGARSTVFDIALTECGIPADSSIISDLVYIYRNHKPNIALCADAVNFLNRYPLGRPLALITDGPLQSQSAKVKALGLENRFDPLIYSDQWGVTYRKPHERPYRAVEESWPSISTAQLIYIADNPLKDFVTPRARGWRTIRIARQGGEHYHCEIKGEHRADRQITSFDELQLSAL